MHGTRRASTFPKFRQAFNEAYEERLDRLGISRYPLTEVRIIEAAAFELAGDEQDHGYQGRHPTAQNAGG